MSTGNFSQLTPELASSDRVGVSEVRARGVGNPGTRSKGAAKQRAEVWGWSCGGAFGELDFLPEVAKEGLRNLPCIRTRAKRQAFPGLIRKNLTPKIAEG